MQTLLAILAITSTTANIPERPQWQPSYRDAYLAAIEKQKPLAVFIGKGSDSWDSGLNAKAREVLKQKYLCVFVDVKSEAGAELAKSFAVDGKGIVIGDKKGQSQAFHHSGDLNPDLVAKALERYADKEVSTTETAKDLQPKPAVQINSYCPSCQLQSSCPGGNCPR